MANRSLGSLTVDLQANTAEFTQGMDKAERSTDSLNKAAQRQQKEFDRLVGRIDPLQGKYNDLDKQQAQLDRLYKKGGLMDTATYDQLTNKIDQQRKSLSRYNGVQQETNHHLDNMGRYASVAAAAVASIGIARFTGQAYDAISSAQKLQASLKTVTGSTEAANKEWERLLDFASTTPFTLDQSVEGFIRMKSLGLDPTMESMTAFGNTSSAMGKDLMQMIEAVADASTFEFERLKEFGIRAKQEGDNVTFTFQGVETTVKKSSKNITEYLENIGNTAFAGAMSDQMETLNGAASNLQDSVYQMWLAIGDAGATEVFSQGINDSSSAVKALTESIENGNWDILFNAFESINSSGRDMIGELVQIGSSFTQMKSTAQASLLDVEAGWLGMKASGLDAYSGLVSGSADLINMGLIPIQKALNYLDSTFANLLDNIGKGLGPAGTELRAQAQHIRDSLMDPVGINVDGLENTSDAIRDNAAALRTQAMEVRGTSLQIGSFESRLFKLDDTEAAVSNTTEKAVEATKKQAKGYKEAQDQSRQFESSLSSLMDSLYPLKAAQNQYRQEQMLLETAWVSGKLSIEQYMEALQRLKEMQQSTQDPSQAYSGGGFGSQLGQGNSFGQGQEDTSFMGMDTFLENAQEKFSSFDELSKQTAASFSESFGSAFNSALTQADSLEDGMRGIGQAITGTVISAIAQMAAEWVAMKAIQLATGQSTQAAEVAGAVGAGSAIAAAYAPAAAMASLASFGTNAVPASAGISSTVALSQGLALTGMAHDWIP